MTNRVHPGDTIVLRLDARTRDILNPIDGLDRVMGDHALYERMLLRFYADYVDGATVISMAIELAEHGAAVRMVHTLKGSSGMIGARELHGRACTLEQALRAPSKHYANALERM